MLFPVLLSLWKVGTLGKKYMKKKKKGKICIALLLKACNKIWVSMLVKSQYKPLALKKKMHENTQTYFWQLDSLAQHKIMVLYCTNIMVRLEYSSKIRSLRNPR